MFKLTVNGNSHPCQPGETVLDALLNAKVNIAHNCKKGTCHSCLAKSLDNPPPASAQVGLKATLKSQNHFLACLCRPDQDMAVKLPDAMASYQASTIAVSEKLGHNTNLLVLALPDATHYKAGQFVNLKRADGLTRSYSIANIPQFSNTLEFHIRRLPGGKFSEWLHDGVKVGDTIAVSEPQGHCFYLPDRREQGLLLVGTGTGLAPLSGILQDALAHGHTGPIHLFHGSRSKEGLYRISEMRRLGERYGNFHYTPCLSGDVVPDGFVEGRVHEVALANFPDLKGWRVFLCGHPDMVKLMQKMSFLKGASMADIYADPFVLAAH